MHFWVCLLAQLAPIQCLQVGISLWDTMTIIRVISVFINQPVVSVSPVMSLLMNIVFPFLTLSSQLPLLFLLPWTLSSCPHSLAPLLHFLLMRMANLGIVIRLSTPLYHVLLIFLCHVRIIGLSSSNDLVCDSKTTFTSLKCTLMALCMQLC